MAENTQGQTYQIHTFEQHVDSTKPDHSRIVLNPDKDDDSRISITSGQADDPRGSRFVSVENRSGKQSSLLDDDGNVVDTKSKTKKK